ncbi:LysM peptidoglycan-binding domain-containing protein [Aureimonas fodinaquatilis]|nr:LysM peptidoglycan-binding domain-containing protein [Aureimonas fodinaquatilis]
MKRKNGVILATACAVGVVGLVVGYWQFDGARLQSDEKVALAKPEAAPAPLANGAPASAASPEPAAPAQAAAEIPEFDIIRVEPDGSAVIAGRGAPDSDIFIYSGERLVAKARSNSAGEFALTLEQPLVVGDHSLRIVSGEGEGAIESAQRVLVSVPMPGREQELLVMLQEPNRPSQVIAAPSTAPQVAGTAPQQADSAVATAQAPVADPDAPAIGAVEIDGDQLFIAGTAAKGDKVRVYLNDEFVTETEIGDKREFLAGAVQEVPVGQHVVRADVVDRAGQVMARAEVPFNRPEGDRMAAVASSPALPGASAAEKADSTQLAAADGALQPVGGRVIIRKGDTLWRISRDTYGDGSRYTVIYLANGDQIRNPHLIYPGQIFVMPEGDGDRATGG